LSIIKRFRKDISGQSVTEFAIILPVFIILTMVVLVFGSIIYAKSVVILAASQGARVGGAIYDDPTMTLAEKNDKIRSTALTIVSKGLSGSDRDVTISTVSNELNVKVTYTYHIPVALIRTMFSGSGEYEIEFTSSYLIL
jgi:Flp pilus assembly protein TadG